jgi:hypothetical protein
LHTKKHGASQPATQPASQAASQEAASQTWPRRPAASQAACREAVPAALVNQKLHTDIANLRHALIDFAKNACLKTATKTLPFFGKAGAGLAPIAFLITPPTVALGTYSATVNTRPTEPTQAADAASLTYEQVDQARHHNTNHLR